MPVFKEGTCQVESPIGPNVSTLWCPCEIPKPNSLSYEATYVNVKLKLGQNLGALRKTNCPPINRFIYFLFVYLFFFFGAIDFNFDSFISVFKEYTC